MRKLAASLSLALIATSALWGSALADGSWIDAQPLQNWNSPGATIPTAPTQEPSSLDPRCLDTVRPAETLEDAQLVAAGWRPVGQYVSGWNVRVITATSSFDGMCRPTGYQIFAFQDGAFAGTASPDPMDARSDGSGGQTSIIAPGITFPVGFTVRFSRYAETDPLCCPSRVSTVSYTLGDVDGQPLVVPASASTSSTSTN